MKKLTLLLTSIFLAGTASAAMLDFERVETHQNTSIDLNQDFQVAHPCIVGRKHIGRHSGGALDWVNINTHATTYRAQCAKWEWIRNCVSQNAPVNLYEGGKCRAPCQPGSVVDTTDDYKNIGSCRRDKHTCAKAGFGFIPEGSGLCIQYSREYCKEFEDKEYNPRTRKCAHDCPEGHSYQEIHGKCVSFVELERYCHSIDEVYISDRDRCERCPNERPLRVGNTCNTCPANHSWQEAQKECVAFTVLEKHCNDRDEIYVAERNRCERCAEWHPIREGNTCKACPAEHFYQAQHKKCISFTELNAFCNTQGDRVYEPETNACEFCGHSEVYRNGVCVQLTGAICREDYRFYYNGSCVRRCTGNTVHDWDTYECVVK